MPVRDTLVSDTGGDIKHDDGALALNAVDHDKTKSGVIKLLVQPHEADALLTSNHLSNPQTSLGQQYPTR